MLLKTDNDDERTTQVLRSGMRGLYLRNLSANLIGFLTIFALNFFTPLEFFDETRVFLFEEKGWLLFFLIYPMVMFLILLIQSRIQRPISRAARLILNGQKKIPARLREKAEKRLINLPLILTLINVAAYIIAPLFVILAIYLFFYASATICFFLFFRSFMIGLISAGLSFFLLEKCLRDHLIPLFSDFRDFTTYVEENDPEEAIQSMRAYFTAMQRAIRLHQGLVLQRGR